MGEVCSYLSKPPMLAMLNKTEMLTLLTLITVQFTPCTCPFHYNRISVELGI